MTLSSVKDTPGSNRAVVMQGITKRFPLVLANDNVDMDVSWGEVHALIGENGAGKSTLMKILYGHQTPDEGTIVIDGQPCQFRNSREAIDRGVGMVYQHFMLVDTLSVTENIILGAEPLSGMRLNTAVARSKVKAFVDRFGFDLDVDARVGDLPLGMQQQVEILKTLYRNARIMIMDEPTAVLTPQETRQLFSFIKEYAAQGNAVIFISHKLDEIMEICDRMSVMRDGQMVGTVTKAETSQRDLATMMVGREVILRVEKMPAKPKDEVYLSAKNVVVRDPVKHKPVVDHVSLEVRAGEIVGIAGIEGNGQSELVSCIAGLRTPDSGAVTLAGREVTHLSARTRRELGLSHIPEDRNERGLVGEYDAAMNSILGDHYHEPYSNQLGFMQTGAIRQHAQQIIEGYDVRPRALSARGDSYSGGNAQKLIVARELEREPSVLIASQPTRGVDIGAIEFIHKQVVAARDQGLAVLLISADLNEVMSLSDRILVLYEGRVMGELSQEEATAERLGLLMAGSSTQA